MENLRDIKYHIKGIENTEKITRAAKTMAQIRFQRAEKKALAARPYAFRIKEIVSQIAVSLSSEEIEELPLFKVRETKSFLYIVFTSDRGLCGNFNNKIWDELLRQIERPLSLGKRIKFIAVGRKGLLFLKRAGFEILSSYTGLPAIPTVSLTNLIVKDSAEEFISGRVDEVFVVYNHYVPRLKYECIFSKFLPISSEVFLKMGKYILPEYIFEPAKKEIINDLLPHYLEVNLLQILFESYTSEYAARILAMDMATNNAQKMIQDLRLKYHKARQAAITKEIIEVISAAEVVK